jgi:hypothetical protein
VPKFGNKRLGELTDDNIHKLLKEIAERAPITANRTFAVFRILCHWAMSRDGGKLIKTSPCDGVEMPTEERARERVLDDAEIKLAWKAFEAVGWPFGPIGKLLLLTGARRDEVASMEWRELDLNESVWRIPKERTKNKRAHEIPLSATNGRQRSARPSMPGRGGLMRSSAGPRPRTSSNWRRRGGERMAKITADVVRRLTEGVAKNTVEGLSLIADAARRSKIKEAEARSLDTGEMMLKQGFAALIEILKPLQNSNSSTADAAYFALDDLMLGAYVIGARGIVDEDKVIDGHAVVLGRKGGNGNSKRKKEDAKDKWADTALERAQQVRKGNKKLSRADLAEKIREMDDILPPKITQIERTIDKWVANGLLDPSSHGRKRR